MLSGGERRVGEAGGSYLPPDPKILTAPALSDIQFLWPDGMGLLTLWERHWSDGVPS